VSGFFPLVPAPPRYAVDWPALEREYPILSPLSGCPQDPAHHAEGDVAVHTRMVCESLAGSESWRSLPAADREVLFTAAVFHDVGKPDCTRTDEQGRITTRGHSLRGSILTRQLLWRRGVPFELRERVALLVRHHMRPFHLIDRDDALKRALEISLTTRCDHLAVLAEADARGRIAADQQRLLDNVSLFREFCREHGCLDAPRPFLSDHHRFLYFLKDGRHPDSDAPAEFRTEAVLLSGLPGAGKDHWLRHNLAGRAVVALDAIREELGVTPTDDQGAVINRARELAREHLRQGRPLAWNATNVSRQLRRLTVELFAAYQARVRIVYLEAPESILSAQNRQRPGAVPAAVIRRMLDRWEVPDLSEAHEVTRVVRS
jgi:predicted kinase